MSEFQYYELPHGYRFCAAVRGDRVPEVFGHVEDPQRNIIKGSSGWWRTPSIVEASLAASNRYVFTKENDNAQD